MSTPGSPAAPLERCWRAHPLVRAQRWIWAVLVTPLWLVAAYATVASGLAPEALGFLVVATVLAGVAVVQWRAAGTEVRLGPDALTIRGVRPQRTIPLADIAGVGSDHRLAHQVVVDTEHGRVVLPRAVTSQGLLGPDRRSAEIQAAIAAALEVSR